MIGHGRRYLRARTEISPDKDGDIPLQCRVTDRQDKVHMGLNSANGLSFCHSECLFPAENPFDYDGGWVEESTQLSV